MGTKYLGEKAAAYNPEQSNCTVLQMAILGGTEEVAIAVWVEIFYISFVRKENTEGSVSSEQLF